MYISKKIIFIIKNRNNPFVNEFFRYYDNIILHDLKLYDHKTRYIEEQNIKKQCSKLIGIIVNGNKSEIPKLIEIIKTPILKYRIKDTNFPDFFIKHHILNMAIHALGYILTKNKQDTEVKNMVPTLIYVINKINIMPLASCTLDSKNFFLNNISAYFTVDKQQTITS